MNTAPYVPQMWRSKARTAAEQRYEFNRHTPDRPGWKLGKCPVSEYFGNINELGLAIFDGVPLDTICLYSTDKNNFTKADAGSTEYKAGGSFSIKDIEEKGATRILWGRPVEKKEVFYCKQDTCGKKIHLRLDGHVAVRGWTDLQQDLHLYRRRGNTFYLPNDSVLRSPDTYLGRSV